MQCAASRLCLDKDYSLRIALPFVCCSVSVLYRRHGLVPSNTRYSKCMTFSYTHLSFMSRESNSIPDGCRSKFMINQGQGESKPRENAVVKQASACLSVSVSVYLFFCINFTF